MKNINFKYLFITIIAFNMLYANSTYMSGQVEYFYMTRLKDSKLVNIPFRLMDFHVQHQINDNFNISGNVGIEYRNRRDTDFMTDSNLEDFLIDLRELYMSYYFKNGEIRIGKQIHGWGSVDENSPIDNLNGYDYYYLLLGGSEKKLGVYSMAIDYSFNPDRVLSFVYSPMHNTSRIPVNDPDYPIGLPAGSSPSSETTIFNDDTPYEYGIKFKSTYDFVDITVSHIDMYDRIFNLTGLTVYGDDPLDPQKQEIVPRYSYRKTKADGIGAMFLFDDFTLSFDYVKFETKDINTEDDFMDLENPFYIPLPPTLEDNFGCCKDLFITMPFMEKTKYTQTAIQFELPLPQDYQINMQFFKHEKYGYSSALLNLSCDELANDNTDFTTEDCANLEAELGMSLEDLEPENLFIPGVGSPYAIITDEAMLINIEKHFIDTGLKLDFSAFLDAAHGDGRLLSFEAEYDIGNGFEVGFGLTKILGDNSIDNYNFNNMKDFSSVRSRITYYF